MNTEFKNKYKLELQEELWRLEFKLSHDTQHLPELEKELEDRKEKASAARSVFVEASNKAQKSKKKADRLEQKAAAEAYSQANKDVTEMSNIITQMRLNVGIANTKIKGLKDKLNFLENYDG